MTSESNWGGDTLILLQAFEIKERFDGVKRTKKNVSGVMKVSFLATRVDGVVRVSPAQVQGPRQARRRAAGPGATGFAVPEMHIVNTCLAR